MPKHYSLYGTEARTDENGNRIDGEYHRYTDEFLQERRKWETWISNGTYGKWQRKIGVKDAEYDQFILKYFDNTRYTKAKIDSALTLYPLCSSASTR